MRSTTDAGITPEIEVLLLCARRELTQEQALRLQGSLAVELDWGALLRLGRRHRLLPLLQRHLGGTTGSSIPPKVAGLLREAHLANAGLALRRTGELLQILRALRDVGVVAVPYKGSALAAQLYGDISLRESYDLDILVERADVAHARELLIARGYRSEHDLSSADRAFMLQSRYSESLRGPDAVVELHWAFTNRDVAFPLTLEDLAPRLTTLSLGGSTVPAFSEEDLLLVLSVHGAKHLWVRLEWICGVAELLRRMHPERVLYAVDRAREQGVELMVLLGALLAHDLLQAPVPAEVLQRARRKSTLRWMRQEIFTLIFQEVSVTESSEEFGSLRHDLLHFRLRERIRDRLRFLAYRILTPSRPEEWRTVSVGRWSFPLHSVVRPMLLAGKIVPATLRYARYRREQQEPS